MLTRKMFFVTNEEAKYNACKINNGFVGQGQIYLP